MKRSGGEVETALGLVIPKMALLSKKDANNRKKLAGLNTGMSVAVTWQDIIIFDTADQRRECPVMYTEGVLFRIENDQLVLKNPETITMPPSILKNHPQEKPNFYVIPIALITEIVDIS